MISEESSRAHLNRLAAGMILDSASLTDELTDEEAQPLIDWGLAQAAAAAADVAGDPLLVAATANQQREALGDRIAPVRRVMKFINDLAADRHELPPDQVTAEVRYLLELGAGLPRPPAHPSVEGTQTEEMEWGQHQANLGNGPFVLRVLDLLETDAGSSEAAKDVQDADGSGT
ncbi:MAG: hypothetical protein PVI09_07620 [Anaerolineae bacterium]|jgi:hypothetical protein